MVYVVRLAKERHFVTTHPHLLAERTSRLSGALEKGLHGRSHAIRLCLPAVLSGENAFLLGPPGAAKGLTACRLKLAFRNVHALEYLMMRFSTPKEVSGPLSIRTLKDEGCCECLAASYLPEVEIVLLNEIWKAGPAVFDTLLTAINERHFRNGAYEEKIPTHLLVAASNELPEADSSLEALYGRMLIRLRLNKVQDKANFRFMLLSQQDESDDPVPASLQVVDEEYYQWQKDISAIKFPDRVFGLIFTLYQRLGMLSNAPYMSDRRWERTIRLSQTSVFFNGRDAVVPIDLILLKDCLWYDTQSLSMMQQQLEISMTGHTWQQQAVLTRLGSIAQRRIQLQQQQSGKTMFMVIRQDRVFSRRPHYDLPPETSSSVVTLLLQKSLKLHDVEVIHIAFERGALELWLTEGGEIRGRLNGVDFAQTLSMEVNSAQHLAVRGVNLQGSHLALPGVLQESIPTEIKQELEVFDSE